MLEERPTPTELTRAVGETALLPNEDPGTEELDDALHWIQVYGELLQFKSSVIETAERAAKRMSRTAKGDIAVDQELLNAQAERYERRAEFWRQRARALATGRSEQPRVTRTGPNDAFRFARRKASEGGRGF